MPKIVHVSETLATGVFSVICALLKHQVAAGYEVHLIGSTQRPDTSATWRDALPPGVIYHELAMEREIGKADIKASAALRRLLKTLRPDVVHLHSSKAGALGRIAAFGLGARVVYQPHGFAFLRRDVSTAKRHIFGVIEAILGLLPGKVVACSAGERDESRKYLWASSVAVVPNGIELDAVPAEREPAEEGLAGHALFGTCGRISPQKDPLFFAEVARSCPGLGEFKWIGGGDFEEGAAALQSAGVTQTGWVSKTDAILAMSRLTIYIQTSAWEGMPISVIEAMSAGVPVIVRDIPGNRDLLVDVAPECIVETPAAMAEQIKRLLDDHQARARLGKALQHYALEFCSAASMHSRFLAVYGLPTSGAELAVKTG